MKFNEKHLKYIGFAVSAVGLILSAVSSMISEKTTDLKIEKIVAEKFSELMGEKHE